MRSIGRRPRPIRRLLEIMQENRVTIDGVSYPIEPPFLVMATQNPIESEGTYNLPEAQLDRFLFKLVVEYPSAAEETDILRLHTRGFGLDRGVADQLDVVTSPAEVREMQKRAESVLVDDHVLAYIATLVRKTRQWPTLVAGGFAPRRRGDPAGSAGRRGPGRAARISCPTTFKTSSCRPCGIASFSRPRPRSRANPPTHHSPSSSGPSRFPCDEDDLAGSSAGSRAHGAGPPITGTLRE